MDKSYKKLVRAYCPSCNSEQDFIYDDLESIEEDLVYWECNCYACGNISSGIVHIDFADI
jgi:formate dehydrogenase maturation protein FdhE